MSVMPFRKVMPYPLPNITPTTRLMIKLTALLLFFGLHAAAWSTAQNVTLSAKDLPLSKVFKEINRQTGYEFVYSINMLRDAAPVSLDVTNMPVEKVLDLCFQKTVFTYVINERIVTVRKKAVPSSPADAEPRAILEIRGTVREAQGEPMPGVNVVVKGTMRGTTTDSDGQYTIVARNGDVLVFSFIGYNRQEVTIDGGTVIDVTLTPAPTELNEVIVNGIFQIQKESFTGAATVVTKEQIKSFGQRNLLSTLANIDPSFDIKEQNTYGSDPNNTHLSIEIRGASSITDVSNLQLQTRGELNTPLFILDGFEVSVERVLDMNQYDVESVVILKDASATAVYGSRGANGVVVITSSRPPVGELRMSYSASMNLEIPDLSSYNLMNAREKLAIEQIAGLYVGESVSEQVTLENLFDQNNKAVQEGVNTDWLKLPTRVGVGQYHRLAISGGDQQFRYSLSVSYNNITGAMKGSERDNTNANLNFQYQFKKLTLSNQLTLGFNKGVNSTWGTFSQYYYMNPYWRPYDANGEPITNYATFGNQVSYNPLYDASVASFSTSDYNNIRNQTSVVVNFSPSLKWDTSLGVTLLKGGSDYFSSPEASSWIIAGIDPLSRGLYTKGTRQDQSYQLSSTLSYGKTFGKHILYLGANSQLLQNESETMSMTVVGFTNENLNEISNGISYSGAKPSTSESTVRSIGFTGTLNYNYDNRYFVEGSARIDGASSFGSESRYAPFYSMGAAWDLSQERFIRATLPLVNRIKFRYTYGITGSLNFSPYQALATYAYDTESQYTSLSGMSLLALGNSVLKWQNTQQHNYGLDVQLWQNRVGFVFNYYRKTTNNLIGEASLPYSNGYTSYKENFGSVRNLGYDGQISVNVIRIPAKQFSWFLSAGVYHNENILVKLSDAIQAANEIWENQNYSNGTFYQYREGESMDEIYVLKSPGVDPLTGEVLYQDPETGNVYNTIGSVRKIAVGSGLPKVNGRLASSLRYKNLMLDVSFSFRLGAKKLNNSLLRVENAYVRYNMDRRVLGTRWQKPGDITAFKDIASEDNTMPNDRFVFTEKSMTLSTVNITYQFPKKILDALRVKQMNFSSSITDVFYLSNIEMERGTDYPYAIRPSFNLAVTF